MNEYENNNLNNNVNSTDATAQGRSSAEQNGTQNGATVNYSSERPNGEYHYGYRGSYNPSYNNRPNNGYQYNNASGYSYNGGYNNGYGNYNYAPPRPAQPEPPKAKEKKPLSTGLICALLAACIVISAASGFVGAFIGRTVFGGEENVEGTGVPSPSQSDTPSVIVVNPDKTTVTTGTYADVATAVQATVVEISTEIVQTSSLFGQYVTGGAGSGVIISSDGLILTNYHVIAGATKIVARLSDGTEYEAVITGSDAETDIALLKINATGLKFATMGNSDALVVGQEVVAIGNPLGELGGSVTNGIVSALDREVEIEGEVMNLLQTNAAVNPGNSGGGLFNLAGELVGVVNAKSSGTGIEGIGFAIPVNDAIVVIEELSKYGYVRGRVHLGIKYNEILEITMQYYYYGYTKPGVYVVESPLNPELKKNDRIVAIDDVEITTAADIKAVLRKHEIGDTLKVTVVRNGRNVNVTVKCYEYVPEGVESKIDFETKEN
ncbi:MAG: trypsin-like peptidase domain-containing protein [Clostridia bacterium]|nr:trypsin-like peptidase domain-containing protein [Clostridia bacterium]